MEGFFYNDGMFNLYRSFLKGVLLFDGVGGMGGWVGGWDGVNFLHTLCVYRQGIYLVIYKFPKNSSPTFLWFSKIDVKLGSWDYFSKTFISSCVFEISC